MTRTLLVDADLLAYRASAGTQRVYHWDGVDGPASVAADFDEAKDYAEEELNRLIDRLQPDDLIICLSDDFNSFRKERVDPTYKANRNAVERPVYLYDLKDWLRSEYVTEERVALEADDVMGIIATDPTRTDERIIVSADKDMLTVPGKLYRPHLQKGKKPVILDVTPEAAARFHLFQTLTGDTTDGYPGCPGVGPMNAELILDQGMAYVGTVQTITRGQRKGQTITKWVLEQDPAAADNPWGRVVSAFVRHGLTEADALRQARLARILHHQDYDGARAILWTPPR